MKIYNTNLHKNTIYTQTT